MFATWTAFIFQLVTICNRLELVTICYPGFALLPKRPIQPVTIRNRLPALHFSW